MLFIKRALLHTSRKKKKSILIFFILFFILTFTFITLSMKTNMQYTARVLRRTLTTGFTLENAPDAPLSEKLLNNIQSDNRIKEYNTTSTFYPVTEHLSLTPGFFASFEGDINNQVPRFIANRKTEYHHSFLSGDLVLTAGRHITPDDDGKALISETLATANRLDIGSTLTASVLDENGEKLSEPITLEVAGIYQIVDTLSGSAITPECDIADNFIFTDTNTARNYYSAFGSQAFPDYASFFVKDPADLDIIIEKYDTGTHKITREDKAYQNAVTPLAKMEKLMAALTLAILITGVFLLSLVLAMWTKNRIHEIGIYISSGLKRISIIIQFLTEILLIFFPAFLLSLAFSSILSGKFGTIILQTITATTSGNVTARDTMLVFLSGLILIVLSVSISATTILRLKPQKILSAMS